jgi:hypothetical protein
MTNKLDFFGAIYLPKKRRTGSIFSLHHREIFQIYLTSLKTFYHALLRTDYTCTRENFPLSILRWDKGCTYRRRRHFKPRAIAQRAIIDREYVMPLAWRAIQVIVIRDRTLNFPHF